MPTASIVKGRGYLNHNDRTIKQVNSRSWKPELSSRNIVYVNEPIQNVYHELFDSALENYNQTQIKKNHPERITISTPAIYRLYAMRSTLQKMRAMLWPAWIQRMSRKTVAWSRRVIGFCDNKFGVLTTAAKGPDPFRGGFLPIRCASDASE